MIAISVSDATRHVAKRIAAWLSPVAFFEADGRGTVMETAILGGTITGVIDLTPSELIFHRETVGPDRLTAAAFAGIPQVISTGGLIANPAILDAVGKEIVEKASAARGPTRIVVPADAPPVLLQSLRNWVYPPELLVESVHAFESESFAEELAATLRACLR